VITASTDQTTWPCENQRMTDVNTRTARRRKIIGGALAVALAAVLVAIVVVRSSGEKVLNENGETLVLVDARNSGGMDAQASGVLADVNGCLGLTTSDGQPGRVVIWPHGTTVKTPEPLRVTIAGTTYELGDTITIGGGEISALEPSSYFYDRVPDACRTDVLVANNG
jgi:hypothetical protein